MLGVAGLQLLRASKPTVLGVMPSSVGQHSVLIQHPALCTARPARQGESQLGIAAMGGEMRAAGPR